MFRRSQKPEAPTTRSARCTSPVLSPLGQLRHGQKTGVEKKETQIKRKITYMIMQG